MTVQERQQDAVFELVDGGFSDDELDTLAASLEEYADPPPADDDEPSEAVTEAADDPAPTWAGWDVDRDTVDHWATQLREAMTAAVDVDALAREALSKHI